MWVVDSVRCGGANQEHIEWLLCWWSLTGESRVLFFQISSGCFLMVWLRNIFLGLTLKPWNLTSLLLSDICVQHPCWKSHFSVSVETVTATGNCKVSYCRDLCFVKVPWWAVWSLIPCERGDSGGSCPFSLTEHARWPFCSSTDTTCHVHGRTYKGQILWYPFRKKRRYYLLFSASPKDIVCWCTYMSWQFQLDPEIM